MKSIIVAALLCASISAHARNTSANHGHHGSANNGALGAASVGASTSAGAAAAGSTGMGGSYWSPNLNAAPEDAYQPWPQSEMARFQKP